MKEIELTVLCKCSYTAFMTVPDELLQKSRRKDLTQYINEHLIDVNCPENMEWVSDEKFTEKDLDLAMRVVDYDTEG